MWNKFGVPEIGNASDCYQKQIQKAVEEHDRLQAAIDGIPLDRLEEICNAEREGRCMVLPCKVGDTVWINDDYWGDLCKGYVYEIACTTYWGCGIRATSSLIDKEFLITRGFDGFGKTIFLAYETAEAALKERDNDA